MNRKRLLKIINPVLFALTLNQLATGFKPRLYGAGTFRLMHKQMALILAVVLLTHLALNFPWVRNTYLKPKSNRPLSPGEKDRIRAR